jgi:hypothetical protein
LFSLCFGASLADSGDHQIALTLVSPPEDSQSHGFRAYYPDFSYISSGQGDFASTASGGFQCWRRVLFWRFSTTTKSRVHICAGGVIAIDAALPQNVVLQQSDLLLLWVSVCFGRLVAGCLHASA